MTFRNFVIRSIVPLRVYDQRRKRAVADGRGMSGSRLVGFAVGALFGPALVLAGGASLVVDVAPGATSSHPLAFAGRTAANVEVVYFMARPDGVEYRLWRTDGTPVGTFQVSGLRVHEAAPDPTGGVFFAGESEDEGIELYRSDGDAATASLYFDAAPGSGDGLARPYLSFQPLGGHVVVRRSTGSYWIVPGASPPTPVSHSSDSARWGPTEGIDRGPSAELPARAFGVLPGSGHDLPVNPADLPLNAAAHILAASGSVLCGKASAPDQNAGILLCADAARTYFSRIVPPSSGAPLILSDDQIFEPAGDALAFIAFPGGRPWLTDGSSAGTRRLSDQSVPDRCVVASDPSRFFFIANDQRLWIAGPEEASAQPIAQLVDCTN